MEIFNDFTLGFIFGFVLGGIIGFIIEILCIASGKSSIDTWTYEDTDEKTPNKPIDED